MIMTRSYGSGTVPPSAEAIRTLSECDDITTFSEAGWFCAVGWRENRSGLGRDRVIAIHFNSSEDYRIAIGEEEPGPSPWDLR